MIGEVRHQIDEAIEELHHAGASVTAGKGPLDGAVDSLRRQTEAKAGAIPTVASILGRIAALKASMGILGASLMDGKIASQDMIETSTDADDHFTEAFNHAVKAKRLVRDAVGEDPNETSATVSNIRGVVGTARMLKQTGEVSTPQFGDAVEKVQSFMATLDELAAAAAQLEKDIPNLGFSSEAVSPYLNDVPFYPEETTIIIGQGIQQIQQRVANW